MNHKRIHWLSLVASTLGFAFAGWFMGALLAWGADAGAFVHWHHLPPPPAKATDILAAQGGRVFIRTANGAVYYSDVSAFEPYFDEAWTKVYGSVGGV